MNKENFELIIFLICGLIIIFAGVFSIIKNNIDIYYMGVVLILIIYGVSKIKKFNKGEKSE